LDLIVSRLLTLPGIENIRIVQKGQIIGAKKQVSTELRQTDGRIITKIQNRREHYEKLNIDATEPPTIALKQVIQRLT